MKPTKEYSPPKAQAKGNAQLVVLAAPHRGCVSNSARAKKG